MTPAAVKKSLTPSMPIVRAISATAPSRTSTALKPAAPAMRTKLANGRSGARVAAFRQLSIPPSPPLAGGTSSISSRQIAPLNHLRFINLDAHPRLLGQTNNTVHRLHWLLEEELVDFVPLDQVFQERAGIDRLCSDQLNRGWHRVAVRNDR